MKLSVTITPYRLTPKSKDAPLSLSLESGDEKNWLDEVMATIARQLADQPMREHVNIVIDRTDV